MPVETPLPKDHPLMLAWEEYKATAEYSNSLLWAAHDEHRVGSMWAAFSAGWAHGTDTGHVPAVEAALDAHVGVRKEEA